MPERSEPTALPRRLHRAESSPESTPPAADPRLLRRVAEALGDGSSPGSPSDQR